jgi:hypothetical protein
MIPPTTPPAIAPFLDFELAAAVLGKLLPGVGVGVGAGVVDGDEEVDGETGKEKEAKQDTSVPLLTKKSVDRRMKLAS